MKFVQRLVRRCLRGSRWCYVVGRRMRLRRMISVDVDDEDTLCMRRRHICEKWSERRFHPHVTTDTKHPNIRIIQCSSGHNIEEEEEESAMI